MLALSLAFAACLGWGIGDFIGGLKSRVVPVLSVLALSCLSGLVLMAVLVALRGMPPPADTALFFAPAAGVVGVLGLLCLFRGMALGSMAMVAAVSATGVALPVLMGLYGGDDPSGLQLTGMAAAVIGAVMAVREKGAGAAGVSIAAGAGLALGAALAFGSFFILIDLASGPDPLWAALLVRLSEGLCLLPVVLVTRPALGAARCHLPAILGVGGTGCPGGIRLQSGHHPGHAERGLGGGVALPGGHGQPGGRDPARAAATGAVGRDLPGHLRHCADLGRIARRFWTHCPQARVPVRILHGDPPATGARMGIKIQSGEPETSANPRVEAPLARELEKFRVLYDLAVAMTADHSLDDNLSQLAAICRRLLGVEAAFIALRDEDRGAFCMHVSAGIRSTPMQELCIPCGHGLAGLVSRARRGRIVPNYAKLEGLDPDLKAAFAAEGLISGMGVPIQMGDRNLGVLYGFNRCRTDFDASQLDTLFLLGNLAAVEITRKRAENALQQSQESLEARVRARTAELRRINAQLRQEIEDRRQVEDALRQSEERFP